MTEAVNNISSFSNTYSVLPNKKDTWEKIALKIAILVISFPIAFLKDLFNIVSEQKSDSEFVLKPDIMPSTDKKSALELNQNSSTDGDKKVGLNSAICQVANHSIAFLANRIVNNIFAITLASISAFLAAGYCLSRGSSDEVSSTCHLVAEAGMLSAGMAILSIFPSAIHQIGKQISDYKNNKIPSIKGAIFRGIKWIVYPAITGATIGLASFPIRQSYGWTFRRS